MISVGFKTDKGVSRSANEDSVFVLPDRNLYMVADGVGGHNSGEIASRIAVSFMGEFSNIRPVEEAKTPAALKEYFTALLNGANQLIFDKSYHEDGNKGMATTAVLCYIRKETAYVINVGDSRAYLIRDGRITQISKDHTLVREMVDDGILTEEEAANHPDQHIITRALGGEPKVKPDFFTVQVRSGDTLILCSDGLYGEVDDQTIAAMCSSARTMHELAGQLVDQANENGGEDNISVVCIRIQ